MNHLCCMTQEEGIRLPLPGGFFSEDFGNVDRSWQEGFC